MQVLDERVKQRRKNFEFYKDVFSSYEGISFLDEPEGHFSNRWLTTILVDREKTGGVSREDIRLALADDNIEARPLWKPMHLQPVFKDAFSYTNGVSESLFNNGLCLPSGSNLSDNDLKRVSDIVKSLLN